MSFSPYTSPPLGKRFKEALVWAADLHALQARKSRRVPYVSHVLGVASLVIEADGSEDVVIAGLLHDAVEDQGGQRTLDRIRRRFGSRVARLVAEVSEGPPAEVYTWREKKEAYIRDIRRASRDARLVATADKVHNIRTMLGALDADGEVVWTRFGAPKEGTVWFYGAVARALGAAGANPLLPALRTEVTRLRQRARLKPRRRAPSSM